MNEKRMEKRERLFYLAATCGKQWLNQIKFQLQLGCKIFEVLYKWYLIHMKSNECNQAIPDSCCRCIAPYDIPMWQKYEKNSNILEVQYSEV